MGFCPRFSNVAVALLASTLLKETVSQLTPCNSSSTDFDYEVTVGTDSNVDIRWSVDTAAETISFEVSSAALAWVGVGFSSNGDMIDSDAVIGLPDNSSVTEYDLTDKDIDAVLEYEEQEITDISIFQGTNITTITFTRPLNPNTTDKEILSAIPGDQTWLIYAFGTDNELAFHGAENDGSVLLDLFCGDDGAGSPTPTMDPLGTNETVTPIPTPAPVDGGGGGNMTDSPTAVPSDPTGGNGTDVPTPTPAPVNGGGGENATDSPTAVPSDPTGGNGTDVPTPTPAPVNGGGGGNMTDSPTAVASGPPTGGNGTDVPTPNMTVSPIQAPEEEGAAYRVSGGLWATAATVTAAVLGAAMAV